MICSGGGLCSERLIAKHRPVGAHHGAAFHLKLLDSFFEPPVSGSRGGCCRRVVIRIDEVAANAADFRVREVATEIANAFHIHYYVRIRENQYRRPWLSMPGGSCRMSCRAARPRHAGRFSIRTPAGFRRYDRWHHPRKSVSRGPARARAQRQQVLDLCVR